MNEVEKKAIELISKMIDKLNEEQKDYLFQLLCDDKHTFGKYFEE